MSEADKEFLKGYTNLFTWYYYIDSHPYTGTHEFNPPIKGKIKDNDYTRRFFNGTEGVEQVEDLTIGNIYEIYKIDGCGDIVNAFLKDDKGNETEVMLDWFEQP